MKWFAPVWSIIKELLIDRRKSFQIDQKHLYIHQRASCWAIARSSPLAHGSFQSPLQLFAPF